MARFSIIFSSDYTEEQIRSFASSNGINIEAIVIDGTAAPEVESEPEPETPITGEHLQTAANVVGKSVLEIAQLASSLGITTVEEALRHRDVPSNVKEALEQLL